MPRIDLPHDHGHAAGLADMPDARAFSAVSEGFRQMADASRIRIFWLLCHYEECVVNISALMEMSSPAVSHHLRQMREAGLIVSRRDGREVYYKAADTQKAQLLHHMIEMLADTPAAQHPAAHGVPCAHADRFDGIRAALADVPAGAFRVEDAGGAQHAALTLRAQTEGRGRLRALCALPGVTLWHSQVLASQAAFAHDADAEVLQIDHCRAGRIGWMLPDGQCAYLGEGEAALHTHAVCAHAAWMLPLGYFEGISLAIDLRALARDCPPELRAAGVSAQALRAAFGAGERGVLDAGAEIAQLFAPLYDLPPAMLPAYARLKAQEALLTLARQSPARAAEVARFGAQQIEAIRAIHAEMTAHPERRYTIEALSRQTLMNTSTLKAVFKAVYGQPIATYMKGYRVQQAMRLLRETPMSIADVAARMGYETQGKFTKAFKDVTGVLPTAYRRGATSLPGGAAGADGGDDAAADDGGAQQEAGRDDLA